MIVMDSTGMNLPHLARRLVVRAYRIGGEEVMGQGTNPDRSSCSRNPGIPQLKTCQHGVRMV